MRGSYVDDITCTVAFFSDMDENGAPVVDSKTSIYQKLKF